MTWTPEDVYKTEKDRCVCGHWKEKHQLIEFQSAVGDCFHCMCKDFRPLSPAQIAEKIEEDYERGWIKEQGENK